MKTKLRALAGSEKGNTVDLPRATYRREQFIRAATKVMGQTGYHSMTMQELAREAGVSAGLVYQYFADKQEVLLAVIVDILEAYRREVPFAISQSADTVEQLILSFIAYSLVVDENRDAAVLAYRESKTLDPKGRMTIKSMEEETTDMLAEVLRRGIDEKIFLNLDAKLIAYNLIVMAHMWALKHWNFAKTMLIEDYIIFQLRLLLGSILDVHGPHREKYLAMISFKTIKSYRTIKKNRK